MAWAYIGERIFHMLILVGAAKMADHLVREMMGLKKTMEFSKKSENFN